MSTTQTTAQPTKPTFAFNQEQWDNKLKQLEALKQEKAGKQNYNPFLWFNEVVQPKLDAYNKGDRSETLFNSFLKIANEVPSLAEQKIIIPIVKAS